MYSTKKPNNTILMIGLGLQNVQELINAAVDFGNACKGAPLTDFENPKTHCQFQALRHSLAKVSFDDFIKNPDFKSKLFVVTEAEYYEVYRNDFVHIMAIFMPPKTTYPLHDHPEMLVCSKVLKGEAFIQHYDIVDKEKFYKNIATTDFCELLARQSHGSLLKENDFDCVTPHRGNLHSIVTNQRTVILDVMFNYYDDVERTCSFFVLGDPKGEDLFELIFDKDEDCWG